MNIRNRRTGFTLVELLAVIVIIGILVALITPAVFRARLSAQKAQITAEINQLDMALARMATESGDSFPPDFTMMTSDGDAYMQGEVKRYMARRFPNFCAVGGSLNEAVMAYYADPQNDWGLKNPGSLKGSDRGPEWLFHPKKASSLNGKDQIDAAEALVFWLGGLSVRQNGHSSKFVSFSANPANPIEGSKQTNRIASFYDFQQDRLVDRDSDGWYEYIPPGNIGAGNGPPYVYFNSKSYAKKWNDSTLQLVKYPPSSDSEWGYCKPYGSSETDNAWANQKKFQIISAGLDGFFGSPNDALTRLFPRGEKSQNYGNVTSNYDNADLDNLTNFAESDLEGKKP